MELEELKKLARRAQITSYQPEKDDIYNQIENYYHSTFKQSAHAYDEYGATLLHWATICNQYHKVVNLIETQKADVNSVIKPFDRYCISNYTPLYLATSNGYVKIVEYLLAKKADVSIKPVSKYYHDGLMNGEYEDELISVIDLAKQKGNPKIIKLFELPSVNQYIFNRTKDEREYKFTLFCNCINFGGSKTEKLRAANKLKSLIEEGKDDLNHLTELAKSDPKIKHGQLGDIYKTSLTLRK